MGVVDVHNEAVRMMRRAQWFLMSLPIAARGVEVGAAAQASGDQCCYRSRRRSFMSQDGRRSAPKEEVVRQRRRV